MPIIHFTNVGRDKLTWSVDLPAMTLTALIAEVKQHRALLSHDLEFDFDNQRIYAGIRTVGEIRIDGEPQRPREDGA